MEAYGSFEDLVQAFVEFANKVPFYGSVIVCGDDAELVQLRPRLTRRVVSYGLTSEHVDIAAVDVQLNGFGSSCTVVRRETRDATAQTLGALRLQVPGRHSVQNALAAVAVGLELDVPFGQIAAGLADFQGAERRFQHYGTVNGIRVVDDYGHHPTEIAAVLAAARAARPSRVIVAFQPHRYTRTRDLMREFGLALAGADEVVLTDIYAASEEALPGVTVEALAASINTSRANPVRIVRSVDDVPGALVEIARPGDLIVTMGAGSIGTAAARVVAAIEQQAGRGAT
jgi:UDP-N-acetylmuramate--alanine ligase